MGRRTAILLASVVLLLVGAGASLSWVLARGARSALDDVVAGRLAAVAATLGRLLPQVPAGDRDRVLAEVAAADGLDAAYVYDDRMQIVADARGARGPVNLLRIDPDRARAALDGTPSVGWAFDLAGVRFLSGYAPLGGHAALAVEGGAEFSDPPRRLSAITVGALVAEGAVGLVAAVLLAWAVRAARRERQIFAEAERAAVAQRVAATVAHEVRNPLGIIRAGAELLRERAGERDRELVGDILDEVQRINRIVEDFLHLSREVPLSVHPIGIGQLLDGLAGSIRTRYPELTVELDVAPAPPLTGDEPRLRQALLNLLYNAAQATSGKGRVSVRARALGRGAEIVVADDGPGIDPKIAPRLFEPFATGRAAGTGLGLAVARRIVERHGGALDLLPTPPGERGARFSVRLPGIGEGEWRTS